jgi:hypothetical protein
MEFRELQGMVAGQVAGRLEDRAAFRNTLQKISGSLLLLKTDLRSIGKLPQVLADIRLLFKSLVARLLKPAPDLSEVQRLTLRVQ